MSADTDAAIVRYARARRAATRNQMRAEAPLIVARMVREWAHTPHVDPNAPRPDWRVALDARISHCPSCDEWIFDGRCARCDGVKAVAA